MNKPNRPIIGVLGLALLASQVMAMGAYAQAETENVIPEGSVAQATDTQVPADVENLKAVAGNAAVTLNWDAAIDNVGVTGYKIYYGTTSVTNDGGTYTMGPVDTGNKISYTISGLENGKTYYFAATAYDAAGNESENYSYEVSATPKADTVTSTTDTQAPKVMKADAVTKNTVKVTFSEGIMLPAMTPQAAFAIKDDAAGTNLEVVKAELDLQDTSQKTVLLTTADQKKAAKYVLTTGIQIKDLANNPIVSGTSDTAIFTGTDFVPAATTTTPVKPAAEENKDTSAPTFASAKAISSTTIEVEFSEPVVLKADARANFIVTESKDSSAIIDVNKVDLSTDGKKVTLTTGELKDQDYNLLGVNIKDAAGNEMPIEKSATTFKGMGAPAPSTPAPTETPSKVLQNAAENLAAKLVENTIVRLSWKAKEENLKDIANFVLYMSTDRGATYGEGTVLDPKTLSYDFKNLKENMVYYFKLTSRDAAGLESEALTTYFTLPKTGPELLLLLVGSGGAGLLFSGKKKKQ